LSRAFTNETCFAQLDLEGVEREPAPT